MQASESADTKTIPYSIVELDDKSARLDAEAQKAAAMLVGALEMREKYQSVSCFLSPTWAWNAQSPWSAPSLGLAAERELILRDGVFRVESNGKELSVIPSVAEFTKDYLRMLSISSNGAVKTLTYKRLKALLTKFDMHRCLNDAAELAGTQNDPRDFSTTMKVDTHVHLSAAMTSRHLLEFIKAKTSHHAEDVVAIGKDGKAETLRDVIAKLGVDMSTFNLNVLDTRADNTFERFDNFNAKYSPMGKSQLRDVFLKSENGALNGRYYAEITKQLLERLETSQYTAAEYRISIYGSKRTEWDSLAAWAKTFNIYSTHLRWLIQIPRIFFIFRSHGGLANFEEMLDNIFRPLFEVTLDPLSHPDLHVFLQHVSGFDSVDDESRPERQFDDACSHILPKDWVFSENPPYAFYSYYFWANIATLNQLRKERGLKTFDFRPHCGESGSIDHLAAAFLTAKHINHGINLQKSTPLQYLYYLSQIGLAVSPLSNNSLFLDYNNNPFKKFFCRGLNVSLSTDDPLQFHNTEEPLLEEYSVCGQRWKMSDVDLSEIARNSVLQSGFEHQIKTNWLGPTYLQSGAFGNDVSYTNVPDVRLKYREDTLFQELDFVRHLATERAVSSGLPTNYAAIRILEPDSCSIASEQLKACDNLSIAMELRKHYRLACRPTPQPENVDATHVIKCINDVYTVFDGRVIDGRTFASIDPLMGCSVNYPTFCSELNQFASILGDGATGTYAHNRLTLLESAFGMHSLMNQQLEKEVMKTLPRDFSHLTKVDGYVKLANGMLAKHLLRFIRAKLVENVEIPVTASGDVVKLRDLFKGLGIPENLTLDNLNVKAENVQYRLDAFQSKHNPFGQSVLKSIFLDVFNVVDGKFFGELAQQVLKNRKQSNPSVLHEFRIALPARSKQDWSVLAAWLCKYELLQEHVRFVVELPMAYSTYRQDGSVESFADMLAAVFEPLFEVTRDPSANPELSRTLSYISGFDVVYTKQVESIPLSTLPVPNLWRSEQSPPYSYILYYIYANLNNLNSFRLAKAMFPFVIASTVDADSTNADKAALLMLADSIHHADLVLRSRPTISYLLYLTQTGVSMSPLSANALALNYQDNPFSKSFFRGLRVSLATDAPLQLHSMDDPLLEEISIACQLFRLSECDLSEICRNSILNKNQFAYNSMPISLGDAIW